MFVFIEQYMLKCVEVQCFVVRIVDVCVCFVFRIVDVCVCFVFRIVDVCVY